jgi:hypothetical protein
VSAGNRSGPLVHRKDERLEKLAAEIVVADMLDPAAVTAAPRDITAAYFTYGEASTMFAQAAAGSRVPAPHAGQVYPLFGPKEMNVREVGVCVTARLRLAGVASRPPPRSTSRRGPTGRSSSSWYGVAARRRPLAGWALCGQTATSSGPQLDRFFVRNFHRAAHVAPCIVLSRSRRLLLLVAALAALVSAPPARADVRDLGPVSNDSALSAHAGWVVWSELRADERWHLVAWHRGTRLDLPVAPRSAPFDADVGSDARARPVVTYSRCQVDPGSTPTYQSGAGYVSPNGLPRQSLARSCGLRMLDLRSGRERSLRIPRPRGASDTTPSMWRGDVGFARLDRGETVAQVMLWHHRSRRLTRLRHGAVPTSCPFRGGCVHMVRRGDVQQLDLGAAGVAFVWEVVAPAVIGTGDGWELRFDDLRTGASRNYGSGMQSGACGALYPVSPTVVGADVWFAELDWECDTPNTTYVRGVPTRLRGVQLVGPPLMWQLAVDGETAYSIRGPQPPETSWDPPCIGTAGPCRLVAERRPELAATESPTTEPFF